MRVDGGIGVDLNTAAEQARDLEAMGYAGAMTAETGHDPFYPLLLAAQSTSKIELITSIAVAFARSPMVTAYSAFDLNAFSKGRFVLGLGSQIQPHIEKRFSMPWSQPAARMREYIEAMRAIWNTWCTGERLQFRGKFYTHTLMTPFFTPSVVQYGAPKVLLAAVGPMMTQVAGEVADGIILHAFSTEKYLREVTLPAVTAGLKASGRSRADFQISYPVFVVTGRDEKEQRQASIATRKQIAFYGSTPAYKGVLDCIGAGELQPRLNLMSKEGKWDEMGTLITDDILNEFAVVAEPMKIAAKVKARYGDVIDRTSVAYATLPRDARMEIIRELA